MAKSTKQKKPAVQETAAEMAITETAAQVGIKTGQAWEKGKSVKCLPDESKKE